MALKKPSDFFGNKSEDNNIPIIESDNTFREELIKVESLSEQVLQLQQELSQKVIKSDLESLVLSQINSMQENFEYLQNDFKKSNKKDIIEFKEKVSELTEIVGNLVENELPKYKKQVTKNEVRIGDKFDELKEVVEENIVGIREEIDSKVNNIAEVIDNNLEHFNNQLQETSFEVKKTTDTYNKLSKILENKVSKENEKLEEYSQVIQSLHELFVELEKSLQEKTSTYSQIIEEKFETISSDVNNKINSIDEDVDTFKNQVSSDISSIKADVVINEQHIKNVDKYIQEHHQELVELKEEVFGEIEKLPVGNLQENLERLEKKIDYIKETYSKIEPEVIVKEVIKEGLLNEPPNTKNSDPLTPLDQKFVTLDQLQEHYRLFINRIQQQLSTIGGGGETRLEFLDDIDRTSAKVNGRFLKYDALSDRWIGELGGAGGSQTLDDTLQLGNSSMFGMNVGVVTATYFVGDGSLLTNVPGSGNSGYANTAGIATYATNAGIATYATNAGIATALQNSRTFEITGDIVGAAVTFDGTGNVSIAATIQPNSVGLGTHTYGDYVKSITATSNQISVSATSGEGSTPILSIPNQFTAPQDVTVTRDLQVNRNLNVTGNITIGGTSATLFSQTLNIFDPDIVLGFRTDGFGNDVSNDNTANHGGVALASTEGTPLVDLFIAGIETNPSTYKKIMWFKAGTFAGLGTDAWLSNYAVGIGSTQFPTGTRLAAGNVQFTQNDLSVVRNINSTGVITATSGFSGNASSATYATIAGYSTSSGIATYASNSGITTYADNAGIATYATSSGIATYATIAGYSTSSGVSTVSGYSTSSGIATYATIAGYSTSSGISTYATNAGVSTYATIAGYSTSSGIATYADNSGIATYATIAGYSTSSGIATYATIAGVSTYATIAGVSTYATIAGYSTSSGIATYATNAGVSTYATNAGISTYATSSGIATYATSSGIATYAPNAGIATYATSSGISTYATIAGYSTSSGVSTVSGYSTSSGIATYATNAGISTEATALQNSRTFEITGDIVASPISFNGTGNVSLAATIQPNSVGLGTDTTGDYVQSITGTSNQIVVSVTSGEGSAPTLSIPNQFTIPQDATVLRDLQVDRNLNVTGNITIGGTSAAIFAQELKIYDPDIVLGFRTDAFGNDISNDTTSNHGGVALASTEGTPLVDLFIAGIETNPATYKKIMWFKAGTFAGLGTDAWLINYAVGIGSTQFPNGTRLAAGNVQFTQNDLSVVRNINSTGIVTATTFSGTLSGYATSSGISTYAPNAGIATYASTSGIATVSQGLTGTPNISVGIATVSQLQVNGGGNFTGVVTASSFSGSGANLTGIIAGVGIQTSAGLVGTGATILDFRGDGISTITVASGIATINITGGGSGTGTATISRSVTAFTPTQGQTTFTVAYTPDYIDVYLNGVKLSTSEYTASNGTSIVLNDGASLGDILETVSYDTSSTFTVSYATIAGYSTSSGNATYATSSGIATYATIAGYSTSSGIATQATKLQNSRTFEITGDIVGSPISFDGTGNVSIAATIQPNSVALGSDTTGDYVQSITGTANQISVSVTSGESSTPVISIPSNPTLPGNVTIANDLQVNNNLNVTGNITIGGTSAYILAESFRVSDADIILGFTTNISGNESSNDTTANHGGVALASTEGSPLVNLNIAGIETLPPTYKKIMWFKANAFAGLNTDAWLTNYAFGVGTTQMPDGSRFAAGNFVVGQDDITSVRNINSTGIVTAATFSGTLSGYASTAGIATYATSSGISTTSQGLTGTPNISVGIITSTDIRIQNVAEKLIRTDGNTVSITYSSNSANTGLCTNPSGDITLAVTNIPTDSSFDNHSIAFTVIVMQTGTARSCTAVTLNGVSRTIKWSGGSLATAITGVTTTTGYDIYNFTGINTVGSASTTANYEVLGIVNGGFR